MVIDSLLIYVSNLESTMSFYSKLGAKVTSADDMGVVLNFGGFTLQCYDEQKVHFKQDSGITSKGVGVFVYIRVDDVDKKYAEIVAGGLTPSGEPKDWPWKKREFAIKDPDGYRLVFYKDIT